MSSTDQRIRRLIERRTGVIFGTYKVHGRLAEPHLIVHLGSNGYTPSISFKSRGFYIERIPS